MEPSGKVKGKATETFTDIMNIHNRVGWDAFPEKLRQIAFVSGMAIFSNSNTGYTVQA